MPTDVNTIMKVVELATNNRDTAGRNLNTAVSDLNAANAQLTQLANYSAEGNAKWMSRAASGVSGTLLQHSQAFFNKLRYAAEYQQQIIDRKEILTEQAEQNLLNAEKRLKLMNLFLDRKQAEIKKKKENLEQKLSDELSNAMTLRRGNISSPRSRT